MSAVSLSGGRQGVQYRARAGSSQPRPEVTPLKFRGWFRQEAARIQEMAKGPHDIIVILVQRNSWSWQTALITSVGGQAEGKLDGQPPYFKHQKVKGRMGVQGRERSTFYAPAYGYQRVDPPST